MGSIVVSGKTHYLVDITNMGPGPILRSSSVGTKTRVNNKPVGSKSRVNIKNHTPILNKTSEKLSSPLFNSEVDNPFTSKTTRDISKEWVVSNTHIAKPSQKLSQPVPSCSQKNTKPISPKPIMSVNPIKSYDPEKVPEENLDQDLLDLSFQMSGGERVDFLSNKAKQPFFPLHAEAPLHLSSLTFSRSSKQKTVTVQPQQIHKPIEKSKGEQPVKKHVNGIQGKI